MQIQPYLFFYGRCDEAMSFYKQAVGATDVELLRFKDAPEKPPSGAIPPGWEGKVMHGTFRVGDTVVIVSDAHTAASPGHHGFSLAITVPTVEDASRVFDALAEGGQVTMPIGKTFFSPRFGGVLDKFGIQWMVVTAA